jgi:hypothetical protein
MKIFLRVASFCTLALFAQIASTTTLAGSNTFVDLAWDVSGPAASGCTQILADATGDASRSTRIIVYGTLNCPALGGGIPMTGVAYVDTAGLFNFSFNMGLVLVSCPRLRQASGACIATSSTGQSLGSLAVSLRP